MKKKSMAIALIVVLIVSLAACSKKDTKKATQANAATQQSSEITSEAASTANTTSAQASATSTKAAVSNKTQANNAVALSNSSSKSDVANFYNEMMKASKASKKVKGTDDVQMGDVSIKNYSNTFISALKKAGAAGIKMGFKQKTNCTLPYANQTVNVLPSDIKSFSVKDAGSNYVLTIVPADENNQKKELSGPQGRFFTVFKDMQSAMQNVKSIKYKDGFDKDFQINYGGGTITVTVNKTTKQMFSGTYVMKATLVLTNVDIPLLPTVTGTACVIYTTTYR